MKKPVSLLACWLALLVCAAARQQLPSAQPPTFRTAVDAVQLDVTVLDKERRPVRGLSAADFTVLEDGKPRQIVAFSPVELPALPAAAPAGVETVPPDVTRNDLPNGRIVIILIDPFLERVMVPGRVTMADPPGLAALRATALRVLDSLGPGDLTAVSHTIYGVAQNLTTDKARLRRAIESSAAGTVKRAEGEDWGSCNCGTCRVEAITRIATALRNEPQRRKTVFFIGERIPLSPGAGQCDVYLEPATKKMALATALANVTVHTDRPEWARDHERPRRRRLQAGVWQRRGLSAGAGEPRPSDRAAPIAADGRRLDRRSRDSEYECAGGERPTDPRGVVGLLSARLPSLGCQGGRPLPSDHGEGKPA